MGEVSLRQVLHKLYEVVKIVGPVDDEKYLEGAVRKLQDFFSSLPIADLVEAKGTSAGLFLKYTFGVRYPTGQNEHPAQGVLRLWDSGEVRDGFICDYIRGDCVIFNIDPTVAAIFIFGLGGEVKNTDPVLLGAMDFYRCLVTSKSEQSCDSLKTALVQRTQVQFFSNIGKIWDQLDHFVTEAKRTKASANDVAKVEAAIARYAAARPVIMPGNSDDLQRMHTATQKMLAEVKESKAFKDIVIDEGERSGRILPGSDCCGMGVVEYIFGGMSAEHEEYISTCCPPEPDPGPNVP